MSLLLAAQHDKHAPESWAMCHVAELAGWPVGLMPNLSKNPQRIKFMRHKWVHHETWVGQWMGLLFWNSAQHDFVLARIKRPAMAQGMCAWHMERPVLPLPSFIWYHNFWDMSIAAYATKCVFKPKG